LYMYQCRMTIGLTRKDAWGEKQTMQNQLIFDHSFQVLEKAVGISQQRHGLIANNISNLDTPGFKAQEIDFKSALKNAIDVETGGITLSRTHEDHLGLGSTGGEAIADSFEEEGNFDGLNWVNMDNEMKKLTENKLVYRTAVEAMLRKINIIKTVIKEGGR